MAKQLVDIGLVANDGTGDPIRTAMTKVNENTTEIYNALGGDTLTNLVNGSGEIELLSTANKISFLYNTEAQVLALDTTQHHGVIAHAHDTGALYYCHGEWRKLLTDNSAGDVTSYTDPLDLHSYIDNVTNVGAATQVLVANGDGTFTWSNQSGGGGNVTVQDEGVALSTAATTLNFVGAGVTATGNGATKTITIPGGSGVATSLDLTDTPASYGTAGQALVVNGTANGLEFATVSGGGGTFASLTEVNTANLDVDDIALQAVSNLVVTAPDSTRYLIDQYPGDNPTIYVSRGQTIAFNLDGVTIAHPFRILDIGGGSQYSTGLIHVSQDGTTLTGINAQDQTDGTLYWKIPGNAPAGTYEYVCQVHSAMNGNIVVADPSASGGGDPIPSRTTANGSTSGTHANNTDENLDITGFKSYSLLKIATDRAAWVRLYITSAKRTADASRLQTQDPAATAGVIAEVVTTGAETVDFTPAALGWNGDVTPGTTIYAAVRNLSGSTSAVDVTLTLLQLEG